MQPIDIFWAVVIVLLLVMIAHLTIPGGLTEHAIKYLHRRSIRHAAQAEAFTKAVRTYQNHIQKAQETDKAWAGVKR